MKGNEDMTRQARMQRELLLLRYTDAITHGDLDTLGVILEQAAGDPSLEQEIWETHLALGEEIRQEEMRAIAEQLRHASEQVTDMAASHFSAPIVRTAGEAADPPAQEVTVGELAAALNADAGLSSEVRASLHSWERSNEPCETDLSVRGIRALLARMGVDAVGRRLVEKTQELLFTLGMQRQGHDVRLAAARRQTAQRGLKPPQPPPNEAEDSAVSSEEETP